MTAREVLDGIKGQLAAITPGPWERPLNTRYRASVTAQMPKGDPTSRWADNVDHEGKPERVAIVSCPIWSTGKFFRKQSGKDLDFIASAPSTVARLTVALESALDACDRIIDNTDGHKPPGPPHPTREQATACRIRAAIENALEGE